MKLPGLLFSLRLALASLLLPAFAALSATAQPVAPSPAAATGAGLPMWVVRDNDSTIYITGTVHILPDDIEWRSDKLLAALNESGEIWLELAEIGDLEAAANEISRLLEIYGVGGVRLSNFLTETEFETFNTRLAALGYTPDEIRNMDRMRPWFAASILGQEMAIAANFKLSNGIDNVLARMAIDQNIAIKGLEQLEDQIKAISAAPTEIELKRLKGMLAAPPGAAEAMARVARASFGPWANGDTSMVEASEMLMRMSARRGTNVDALLKDRNEKWAARLEDVLAGAGISFVAVGAMHLVGPDSLQKRLLLRGIEAKRY